MKDCEKSKRQLIAELEEFRRRVSELETDQRKREDRFRTLVETTSDWVWEVDKDGVYTYSGSKVKDLLGYEPEEVLGKTPLDFMPPEEAERIRRTFVDITRARKPFYGLENTNVHKNGFFVTLETSGVPILDPTGNLVGYRGIDRDITDRKQAEELLKKDYSDLERQVGEGTADLAKANENLSIFRHFAEASSQGIGLADLDGNILYANKTLCRFLGEADMDTMLGQPFSRYVTEESLQRLKLEMTPALNDAGSWDAEMPLVSRDGTLVPVILHVFLLRDSGGKPFAQAVVSTDITERKRAEEELRQSEARRALALHAAQAGTWEWDLATGRNIWSDELWNLYGLEPHSCEPSYESWRQTVHPEDRERIERILKEVVGQEAELNIEWRVNTASDETRWLMSSGRPLRNPSGRVVFYMGAVMDITGRKLSELALERTRNTLEEAQRIAHLGSFEYIAATRTTIWSEEEYRIYGLTPSGPSPAYDEMLDKYIHPDDAALLNETFTRALETHSVYELEHRIVHPDGNVRWVHDLAHPFFDPHGQLTRYVGTTLDITERKLAEIKLRASEANYRAVVTSIPEQLFLKDTNSIYISVNEQYAAALGLQPEDFIGKDDYAFHPPDLADKYRADDRQVIETGQIKDVEESYVVHGQRFWAHTLKAPVRDDSGQIVALLGLFTDITKRKRAEEELRASEERFRTLVEQAPEAIFIQTRGRFAYVNAAMVQLFGATGPEQLVGELVETRMHPDYRARVRERIRLLNEQRLVVPPLDQVYLRTDGSPCDVSASAVPFVFNGERGALVFVRDITVRKRAEEVMRETEARLRTVGDNIPGGALYQLLMPPDGENRYTYLSAGFEKIFGIPRERILADPMAFWELILEEDKGRLIAEQERCVREMAVFDFEFRQYTTQGDLKWIHACSTPRKIEDGSILWDGVISDITDRKLAENELALHREHLEELVKKRTQELDAAKTVALDKMRESDEQRAKAEDAIRQLSEANSKLREATDAALAANRSKSEFLANMSHEIRTPMTAILGFSQLIERRSDLPPGVKNASEIINRSGTSLLALINDILDLSKIEAGRSTLAETDVDLIAMLKDIESLFGLRAVENGLDLDLDLDSAIPRMLITDGQKVRQVLINLLNNAIKFTERGRISVRATLAQPAADVNQNCIRIEVEDTGYGIAIDNLEQVFEAFTQTAEGVSSGGTGLGLTISRAFARMLGGDLTVSSRAGQGTTFTFTFQAKPSNRAMPAPHDINCRIIGLAPSSARPKILVVDDVPENREILCALLSSIRLDVMEAASGAEAIERCKKDLPDLVLMDRRMPQMDGLEAIRRIKIIPGGQAVPMIVVSAGAFEEERKEAFAAGAYSFLSKPYLESQIFEEIQRAVPGIVYLYESDEEIPAIDLDSTGKTPTLPIPDKLLAELRNTVAIGDYGEFENIVEKAVRPLSCEVADRLTELADSFDYERLMAALAPIRADGERGDPR